MAELAKKMDAVEDMSEREGKYLTFSMAEEEYGIGILKIKEIIGMMPITPVPRTPGFVKGVINLRGEVIPVVDLRLKFGMEEMEYTDRTCIIVVEIATSTGTVQIGTVVDAVSEVLSIKGDDIEDTPTFGTRLNTEYILGMAKMEGGVKILLDIDKVLTQQEVELVSKVKKEDSSIAEEAEPEETVAEEAAPEEMEAMKAPLEETVAAEVPPEKKVPEEAPTEMAVEAEVQPKKKLEAEASKKKKVAEKAPEEKKAEAPPEQAHMKSKGDRDDRKKRRKTTKKKKNRNPKVHKANPKE